MIVWDFILNAADDSKHIKTMINLAQVMGQYLRII